MIIHYLAVPRCQFNKRDEHFLHRDASVLEGVAIVTDVVVVVVGIGEEGVTGGKDVTC